jgi:hypothetical protein
VKREIVHQQHIHTRSQGIIHLLWALGLDFHRQIGT